MHLNRDLESSDQGVDVMKIVDEEFFGSQLDFDKSKKQPVSYLIFFAGGLIFIFWIAMFGWIYNQKQGDDDIYGTDLEDILNIDN